MIAAESKAYELCLQHDMQMELRELCSLVIKTTLNMKEMLLSNLYFPF